MKKRWDSFGGQMEIAENLYNVEHGGAIQEIVNDTLIKKLHFMRKSNVINRKKIGDTAAFYIKKA